MINACHWNDVECNSFEIGHGGKAAIINHHALVWLSNSSKEIQGNIKVMGASEEPDWSEKLIVASAEAVKGTYQLIIAIILEELSLWRSSLKSDYFVIASVSKSDATNIMRMPDWPPYELCD